MAPFLQITALVLCCASTLHEGRFFDDFESGLEHWQPRAEGDGVIVQDPGSSNRVLQLTPRENTFSHVLLRAGVGNGNVRMEGRLQFPTEGDGYLGLIYNHQERAERTDFGVLYIKSNGSYVRVSPHYDGNPSWRLYPELEAPLSGDRRIRVGAWHRFRLDVRGQSAALFIDDFRQPVVTFDEAPNDAGRLGLEARPGFGEPVWVDDIIVSLLEPGPGPHPGAPPDSQFSGWQFLPAVPDPEDHAMTFPDLPDSGWKKLQPDSRGALITGRLTQFLSGPNTVVHLRSTFMSDDQEGAAWLALSTANRLDVWLDGQYLGSVAPQPFIWRDHATNPDHFGARLPLHLDEGQHDVFIRVHGQRFAGGGFFVDVLPSAKERFE